MNSRSQRMTVKIVSHGRVNISKMELYLNSNPARRSKTIQVGVL
jgi:hypothetical protein